MYRYVDIYIYIYIYVYICVYICARCKPRSGGGGLFGKPRTAGEH